MPGEGSEEQIGKSSESSDLDLIHGVAEGCQESFRLLFGRWASRLGRFLTRATGSPETAEDLLQEAFLRILKAAPRFEPRGSVGSWMYRICANLAYSHWRRETASPLRGADRVDRVPDIPGPGSESPERLRMLRAFEREAVDALRRFPQNQRIVFLLKVDQGRTYQQIAEILQCPEGTVKSRFHYAVRRLRDELSDWNDPVRLEERKSDVL